MPGAKIICTMGPSCSDIQTIEGMVSGGMNIARINFSHGTHEDFRAMIANIRKVAGSRGEPVSKWRQNRFLSFRNV